MQWLEMNRKNLRNENSFHACRQIFSRLMSSIDKIQNLSEFWNYDHFALDNHTDSIARKSKDNEIVSQYSKETSKEYSIMKDFRALQNDFGVIPLQCMYETVAATCWIGPYTTFSSKNLKSIISFESKTDYADNFKKRQINGNNEVRMINTAWNSTLAVLHDMIYVGKYKPRVMTYHSIMKTCMSFHKYNETIAFYDAMVKANLKPTEEAFALVLNAYSYEIDSILSTERFQNTKTKVQSSDWNENVEILRKFTNEVIKHVRDRIDAGLPLSSRIVETVMHMLEKYVTYVTKVNSTLMKNDFRDAYTDSTSTKRKNKNAGKDTLRLSLDIEEIFCLCFTAENSGKLRLAPELMSWLIQFFDGRDIHGSNTLITLVQAFKRSRGRRYNLENYKGLLRVCLKFSRGPLKFKQARYVIRLLNHDFNTKVNDNQKLKDISEIPSIFNLTNIVDENSKSRSESKDFESHYKDVNYLDKSLLHKQNTKGNESKRSEMKINHSIDVHDDSLKFIRSQKRIIYNLLLKNCVSDYKLLKSIKKEMVDNGIEPDLISYNTILSKLSERGQWKHAFEVLQSIRMASLEPDLITYTTLMSTCIRGKQYEKAISVLDIIKNEPDTAIYSVALEACRYASHLEKAKETASFILSSIQRETHQHMWLEPKLWSSVFRACGNALTCTEIYDKVQRIVESKHLIPSKEDLKSKTRSGIFENNPNLLQHYHYGNSKYMDRSDCKYLFTSAIKGFSLNKDNDKSQVNKYIFQLLSQMKDLNIDVDVVVYGTILSILANEGNYEDALKILQEIPPNERNKLHYTMAIRACNNNISQGFYSINPTTVHKGKKNIDTLERKTSINHNNVMRLFVEMLKFGIEPDLVCMHSVLYKCSDLRLALKIFHHMLHDLNLTPDMSTITTILHIDTKNDKREDITLMKDYIFDWGIKKGLIFNQNKSYLDTPYERDISHLSYAMIRPALRYILREIYLTEYRPESGENNKDSNCSTEEPQGIKNDLMLITGIGHLSIRNLVLETLSEWGLSVAQQIKESKAADPENLEFNKGVITIFKEDLNSWVTKNAGNIVHGMDEIEIVSQFSLFNEEGFLER